jgi:hypothetical protein
MRPPEIDGREYACIALTHLWNDGSTALKVVNAESKESAGPEVRS